MMTNTQKLDAIDRALAAMNAGEADPFETLEAIADISERDITLALTGDISPDAAIDHGVVREIEYIKLPNGTRATREEIAGWAAAITRVCEVLAPFAPDFKDDSPINGADAVDALVRINAIVGPV